MFLLTRIEIIGIKTMKFEEFALLAKENYMSFRCSIFLYEFMEFHNNMRIIPI